MVGPRKTGSRKKRSSTRKAKRQPHIEQTVFSLSAAELPHVYSS